MSAAVCLCVCNADALSHLPLKGMVPRLQAGSPGSVRGNGCAQAGRPLSGPTVTRYRTVKFFLFAVPAQQ